ncbi:MAG: universal stress protein [Planctomycetaceae bacterium]|nr:universal stress protein [Planctomycetaceae bacterium]
MLSFQRILVGVDVVDNDLTTTSREAWNQALKMASSCNAELLLVTVSSTSPVDTESVLTDNDEVLGTLKEIEDVHARLQQEAESQGVGSRSIMSHGRSWYEIIRTVLRENADLVVVGTRGRGRAERLLFGSTSMKLLRKCPCPVWVTRPEPEVHAKTILVADDFQEVGARAVQIGVDLAKVLDARLLYVHSVMFPLMGALRRTEASKDDIDAYCEKVRSEAEQHMQERLAHTDHRTVQAGVQVRVATGPADLAVEEIVREEKISLVIMGTLGRSGIPGILLGNTAERLLPLLDCSVLALKPDGFVSPVTLDS